MRRCNELLLAVLATLALATGAASASRGLEVGTPGTIRNGGRLTFGGGGFTIVCSFTKVLTLHRSIAKTAGTLVGYVKDMRIDNCERGQLRPLAGQLPWHVVYRSFSGTLPRIAVVRLAIIGLEYLLEAFFALGRCLYRGDPAVITGPNERVTEVRVERTPSISLWEESLSPTECPSEWSVSGTLRVTPTLTLRLA